MKKTKDKGPITKDRLLRLLNLSPQGSTWCLIGVGEMLSALGFEVEEDLKRARARKYIELEMIKSGEQYSMEEIKVMLEENERIRTNFLDLVSTID